jgi:hypothetical protein
MRNILVLIGIFVSLAFGEDREALLKSEQIEGLYSVPAKIWLESLYHVGRPTAKVYAYIAFESPELAASFLKGDLATKVGKTALVEATKSYAEGPEGLCGELADSMMSFGMENYRKNYALYRSWKNTGFIDFETFVSNQKNVNYLDMGRRLFADIEAYQHKQGKYSKWSTRDWSVKLSEISGLSGTKLFDALSELVDSTKGELKDYPPYRDHLVRVAQLEKKTGLEFPLAKPIEIGVDEEKPEDLVLDKRPERPIMKLRDAIDVGNVKQVWANLYHKTTEINAFPYLCYALVTDAEERGRRAADILKSEPNLSRDDLYNKTKSMDFLIIISLLVNHGADLSQKTKYGGVDALGIAINTNNLDAVHVIVSAGAEINSRHLELAGANEGLVEYLKKHMVTKASNEERIAVDSARAEYRKKVADLVKQQDSQFLKERASGKVTFVQRDLEILERAVIQFKLDKGRYPTAEEGLKVLVKDYLENTSAVLKDSYGHDYIYVPNSQSGFAFEIISLGPDGRRNTRDDIVQYGGK